MRADSFFAEKKDTIISDDALSLKIGSTAQHRMLCLVYFLFESLSRFEDRSVAGGKGHRLAGRGIPAGSLIAVLAGEGAGAPFRRTCFSFSME